MGRGGGQKMGGKSVGLFLPPQYAFKRQLVAL